MERIAQAPLEWFWLRVRQYPRLFTGSGSYLNAAAWVPPPIMKGVYVVASAAFVGMSLLGLFLARDGWRQIYYLALFPIIMSSGHFIWTGEERYAVGMVPMFAVFAGFAVSRLVPARR